MVVAVIAVFPVHIVNAYPAAFAYADIFVDYCPFYNYTLAYTQVWKAFFFVLFFLFFRFVIIRAHADYAIKACPRFYSCPDPDN